LLPIINIRTFGEEEKNSEDKIDEKKEIYNYNKIDNNIFIQLIQPIEETENYIDDKEEELDEIEISNNNKNNNFRNHDKHSSSNNNNLGECKDLDTDSNTKIFKSDLNKNSNSENKFLNRKRENKLEGDHHSNNKSEINNKNEHFIKI